MAAKRKAAAKAPASTYSLREEQAAMPDLPTQTPQQLTEEARLLERMRRAPELHLRRVVEKYRPRPAPEGQIGFGFAPGPGNQASLFDLLEKKR